MKIINHNKEKLHFEVVGYQRGHLISLDFTNDWLLANLSIYVKERSFTYQFEFLLIEELELLKDWFENILFSRHTSKRYFFIDTPVMLFRYKRAGRNFLKFIVKKERKKIHFDLILDCNTLYNLIQKINIQLKRFPCRCKLNHDIFKKIKLYNIDIKYVNQSPIRKMNLTTRDFKNPYKDYQEMLAGNLYLWLGQSLDVLYVTNHKSKQLTIYKSSVQKLSERLATLEKIGKEKAHCWLLSIIFEVAKFEFLFHKKLRLFNSKELQKLELKIEKNEFSTFYQRFKKMLIKNK